MPKIRKDNKGRNLRPGETQRSDGSYMFVYKLGKKKKYIYDSDLAALRVKCQDIAFTNIGQGNVGKRLVFNIVAPKVFVISSRGSLQLEFRIHENFEHII